MPITTDVVGSNQNCQWFMAGRWFFLGVPVSFTNKPDRHDINEIVLKTALSYMTKKPESMFHEKKWEKNVKLLK